MTSQSGHLNKKLFLQELSRDFMTDANNVIIVTTNKQKDALKGLRVHTVDCREDCWNFLGFWTNEQSQIIITNNDFPNSGGLEP